MDNKKRSKFGQAMWKLVWGQEVEFGDCIFYTIFTWALIGLIWIFTIEKWTGISVWYSLILWVIVVFLIWKQYSKQRAANKAKLIEEAGQESDIDGTGQNESHEGDAEWQA